MLTNGHCKILPLILKARVFELVRSDGTPSGKVIKVAHADLGHKILNSPVVWIGGEREWEIGIQVCRGLDCCGLCTSTWGFEPHGLAGVHSMLQLSAT